MVAPPSRRRNMPAPGCGEQSEAVPRPIAARIHPGCKRTRARVILRPSSQQVSFRVLRCPLANPQSVPQPVRRNARFAPVDMLTMIAGAVGGFAKGLGTQRLSRDAPFASGGTVSRSSVGSGYRAHDAAPASSIVKRLAPHPPVKPLCSGREADARRIGHAKRERSVRPIRPIARLRWLARPRLPCIALPSPHFAG